MPSTSDFSVYGLNSTINHAKTIAKFTEKDPFSGIIDKKFLCHPEKLDYLYSPWEEFSVDNTLCIAKKCENYGLRHNKIFRSEGANINSFTLIYGFTNSHGFFDIFQETRYGISVGFLSKDRNGMQQDSAYFTSHDFKLLPKISTVASFAINRTLLKRDPQKIRSQILPIILEPIVARSIWYYLLTSITGTKQYQKNTFFTR